MDYEKIKEGVRLMLEGIGEDITREGLLETPDRIAKMCSQIYGGLSEDPGVHLGKQFTATENNMVLEKDITFYSTCEHHLLPFYGKAHVAYIPNGGGICPPPTDSGEYDSADCRYHGNLSETKGNYDYD